MTKETNILVTLFKVFFKIGAFTLGGGYAMILIIEAEVVKKHSWLTKVEFLDLIAIAQSCHVGQRATVVPYHPAYRHDISPFHGHCVGSIYVPRHKTCSCCAYCCTHF